MVLLTAHCSLPTAHCPLLTAHCSGPTQRVTPWLSRTPYSVVHTSETSTQAPTDHQAAAPAVPARSALRASRLVDSKATAHLAGKIESSQPPLAPSAAPHDVYLSSEEDASSSADDFSDYDLDSDSDHQVASTSTVHDHDDSRHSHEVTARAVSIVFHGKPSLVNLPPRSASAPPTINTTTTTDRQQQQQHQQHQQRRRISPPLPTASTATSVTADRRLSTATMMPPVRPWAVSRAGTPRPTTVIAPSISSPTMPSFLGLDPYDRSRKQQAGSDAAARERRSVDIARLPPSKSAGSMLRRTLTLAKKHSRPALGQTSTQPSESPLLRRPGTAHSHPPEMLSSPMSGGSDRDGNRCSTPPAGHRPPRRASTSADPRPPATMSDRSDSRLARGHSRLRSSLSISMRRA
ncbi:hypothetical protein GMORB2_2939 [Geosmithia morbida]|uniref:Uncharacterized protein n=1 Tax=Geosmithia morbida TaxID=1094350 RepID=A0A9P4YP17_9HYPO|nr:uncharacterized protein GMORB2_2939 [Geosmithia morbida]KAF4120501.1 hypothetical protein GMORB2_2939 [Geosmithia morbida]